MPHPRRITYYIHAASLPARRLRRSYAELSLLLFGFIITGIGSIVLMPDTADIALPRFVFGYALVWSIGSPITGALTIVTFSKILGSKPQGSYMGYIGTYMSTIEGHLLLSVVHTTLFALLSFLVQI